jgi:hypothetical protein
MLGSRSRNRGAMQSRKASGWSASPHVPLAIGFLILESVVATLTTVFAVQYDNWRDGANNYLFVEHLFVVFIARIFIALAIYMFFHGRLIIGENIYQAPVVVEADQGFFAKEPNLSWMQTIQSNPDSLPSGRSLN